MIPDLDVTPRLDEFVAQAADRRVIGVHARLRADDLTPVALYQQLTGGRQGSFLFESVERGVWSRWSFVGVDCPSILVGTAGQSHWLGRPLAGLPTQGPPLSVLGETLRTLHTPSDPGLPPFSSGMVGYLGYDVKREQEPTLGQPLPDDLGVPDMVMMLASDMAVLDHDGGEVWLIANAINFDGSPERAEQAWDDAVRRVHAMAARLCEPRPAMLATRGETVPLEVHDQRARGEFQELVEIAKEYVRAGDVFQVVPSQRFDVPFTASALDIYRELRVTNPSPYLFLLRLPGFDLVGSSPEALVTVKDGVATTHPIAGTRPRGRDESEDRRLADELLADEKERAEHLMLVDLGRNDLGRVCVPGTVAVTRFMHVGRYSHVMHLEASVTGIVRPGVSGLDVTMACFPAGTLSGAPKLRAMQIIDELEVARRGPYGGVVGYFDFAGNADAAITIRSAVLKDGVAHVQAGAGVVADSVPDNEDTETRNKAAAMIAALGRARASVPLVGARNEVSVPAAGAADEEG
ncbi:anthranilate synthase component I [Propionibacterium australiense]|uniref:Anthranilate synthase component 1 n=1 Tax=Propionibacterium australiense TaxID=119981 RepID=A0A383S493_9ACTN|nr:anthranilate synthase component I [Propionibacterium australiense]RLP11489.1 anthranilate synthase component I [Propionibacterium australiense]SYZ32189.1 anthranilate synthase [Propionibacterium australiense]VEH90717.1 Anthranilate synthase component 1 [Propionibacterium australiense]